MEIIEILLKCVVEGNVVKLPQVELPRDLYVQVKKKLELIGGKWKSGRIQGFVFEEDPTELLASLQSGDERNIKKEYQFYATPANLANYLVSKAEQLVEFRPDMKILEPSAGDGALVKAVVKHYPRQRVDCIEIRELNRIKLQKVSGADIIGHDFIEAVNANDTEFLLEQGQYDLVIANPPFSNNQDIDHIMAMYKCLKPGGALVTIASLSWMNGSQKKQVDFRNWLEQHGATIEQVQPGEFKESGAMVGASIITLKKNAVSETAKQETQTITQKEPKENPTVFEAEHQSPNEILKQLEETHEKIGKGFSELKQMFNNTDIDMNNFFKQLSETMGETELTFVIKQKKDTITLMVLASGITTATNLTFTGTAEDFDNEEDGFLAQLKKPMAKIKGLVSNVDEFEKELDGKAAPKKSTSKVKTKDKAAENTETTDAANAVTPTVDPAQVDLEKSIEEVKSETEEERKAREEREIKLADLDKKANDAEAAGDYVTAIEAREEAKSLSEAPAAYQAKIDELFKKAEDNRIENLNAHLKQADEEAAKNNFRVAAKCVKEAKQFHKSPEELDVRIKELLGKATEYEFENM